MATGPRRVTTLSDEFKGALSRLELNDKRKRVIAAHTEMRGLLEGDNLLNSWGVDTILIGSYARDTAIYPGKDVDVFTKLTKVDTSENPRTVFEGVRDVLVEEYEDRAEPQDRSIKVSFSIDGEDDFHVDVVPAVKKGERWAIPRHDTTQWDALDTNQRWVETDPEELTVLTAKMNGTLKVDGQGAYVPVVKLVRQSRRHHRGDQKPGGFYFELLAYWAFKGGVQGDSFAEFFANTLRAISAQLAGSAPLIDPVLGHEHKPSPKPEDRGWCSSGLLRPRNQGRERANPRLLPCRRCLARDPWR